MGDSSSLNNTNEQWKNVGSRYKSMFKNVLNGFGMKLRTDKVDECDSIFKTIFSVILPEVSKERIQPGEWFIDSRTLATIPDGQIVVVAHHKRVSRFMAIISTLPIYTHHEAVPDVYKRVLHRIIIRKPNNSKKSRIYLKPQGMVKLLSTRRGIYAINREFFNLGIVAKKIGPKEYRVDPTIESMLYTYYMNNIYGIEQRPKIVKQIPDDKGIEQFLLGIYPNQKWKEGYEHVQKTKMTGGSSASDTSSTESSDGEKSMASSGQRKTKKRRRNKGSKTGNDIRKNAKSSNTTHQIGNSIMCPSCTNWLGVRLVNERICVDSSRIEYLMGRNAVASNPHADLQMLYSDGLSSGRTYTKDDDPDFIMRDAYVTVDSIRKTKT